ncbi:desulfoferrodoxin ferrous iron-binding domain protein [Thermanaerovibrio velox DSM 12556]|uniref:Desulfoferrodoxin ferrous iron-binding domain protein n=1 Tax=Thermanaerovibrio velox DSM 12556 TaxID=926567 RepID=H0UMQ1_9BACT|nr:class II SORL domain-containing protein [Thermanaerovibrio velox]EHM09196.1 desulfoferrodoxin ferrous iron-binding domain protein [Thermanaerovibrio velox DSM 12556]
MKVSDLVQSGDWKGEKHVPVIEAPETVKAGDAFEVKVSVGKEIPHPNTTEHHIRWIQLFFKPEGAKFPYEVGKVSFEVHGESVEGANQGPVHTEPFGVFKVKAGKGGTLVALSYCNIHGLWESSLELKVE